MKKLIIIGAGDFGREAAYIVRRINLVSPEYELIGFVDDGEEYQGKTVDGYLMNSEGNSFDVTPTGGSPTVPFRPYFIAGAPTQAAPAKNAARSIIFTSNETTFSFEYDNDPTEGQIGDGSLLISALRHKITVTSSLLREADVRIVNTSGITVANFTIQPGETIDTNIGAAGVYVVRADGGRIQKKFAIK